MKTNGVVRRFAASPPGLERWEAQCLLCPWRSEGRRLYASKSAAELGIGMHLSVIHKLNLKKRRVEERAPRERHVPVCGTRRETYSDRQR